MSTNCGRAGHQIRIVILKELALSIEYTYIHIMSRTVPLHLVTFAIIAPDNSPIYVHSYTGPQDELRYNQLAHSALDVVEERGQPRDQRGQLLYPQSHTY